VGLVERVRPYSFGSRCDLGQFPFGAELDVESKDLFPGVRRMLAVVWGVYIFPSLAAALECDIRWALRQTKITGTTTQL
jgi:hypothetical protein